jgi:hypothetical protein
VGLIAAALLALTAGAQAVFGEVDPYGPVTPYGELYQHTFLPDGTPVSPFLPEPHATVASATAPAPYGELYQHPSPGLVAPTASDGIDWTDAGIGAGIAIGVLLLALAGATVLRRRGLAHS